MSNKPNSSLRLKIGAMSHYNCQCFYCDENITLDTATRDHFIPKASGFILKGNMALACKTCNHGKENAIPCRDLVEKFVCHWITEPKKGLNAVFDEFIAHQKWITILEIFFGKPNIAGVVRAW